MIASLMPFAYSNGKFGNMREYERDVYSGMAGYYRQSLPIDMW